MWRVTEILAKLGLWAANRQTPAAMQARHPEGLNKPDKRVVRKGLVWKLSTRLNPLDVLYSPFPGGE